jgi:diguanylate cyclase (GGDEF)-like protein
LIRVGTFTHPRAWRLSSRMAAWSLLLLLALQTLAFFALREGIERNARASLADQLAVGERVWNRVLEQRAAKLLQGASLLAADYGFRAAVSSKDSGTIESALENQGARIEASVAALLDTRFQMRAHAPVGGAAQGTPQGTPQGMPQDQAMAGDLARLAPQLAQRGSVLALLHGKPHQFVMVPMKAPLLIGWVLMGFELDRAVVQDLHAVAGLHATLVLQPTQGPPQLLHSSLDAARQPEALAALADQGTDTLLQGEPLLLRTVLLSQDSAGRAVLRLSGSLSEAVAPYRSLQLAMAAITVLGLALFGLGSIWTSRVVTRPLATLLQASERLGRGDYDTPLAGTTRQDEVGELAQAFESMRGNIAEQQHAIRRLAYWDRLTGLPNRLQFRDAVLSATAQKQPLAVVMLDLDRFKHVNDVLGYAFGDRLLQGVAERLQQAVRPGDVVARLGGDEFALLLPQADAGLAQAVAARISAAFEQPLQLDDQRVDLSAGLGIAVWPDHAQDADSLLSRAEVAMYAAKRQTAGAQLYDASLDSNSGQTLSLLSELRQAVDNQELRLFIQPKVDVATGALVGAEGLVRWQHPVRGLVPPMDFIPFAEQTGYVRQLTLWVFEEACRQQAELVALGVRRLSVNLSTRDLMDLELPDKLEALLLKRGARAEGFCLEITESAIMDDPQRAEATLNRLHQRGYKLSIDDFGTGYSSLAYLRRLPVQELKIDKSFVMAMEREEGDAKIVRSTIDLAHNLGLSVVAEGVENAAILAQLGALGCDEAQGYFLSKPVPLEQLRAWAEKRSQLAPAVLPLGAPASVPLH